MVRIGPAVNKVGVTSLRLALPPAGLEYEGERPPSSREGFGCRSRTRESLESLGRRVPVRPKSYDFGYRFRRQRSLDPDCN